MTDLHDILHPRQVALLAREDGRYLSLKEVFSLYPTLQPPPMTPLEADMLLHDAGGVAAGSASRKTKTTSTPSFEYQNLEFPGLATVLKPVLQTTPSSSGEIRLSSGVANVESPAPAVDRSSNHRAATGDDDLPTTPTTTTTTTQSSSSAAGLDRMRRRASTMFAQLKSGSSNNTSPASIASRASRHRRELDINSVESVVADAAFLEKLGSQRIPKTSQSQLEELRQVLDRMLSRSNDPFGSLLANFVRRKFQSMVKTNADESETARAFAADLHDTMLKQYRVLRPAQRANLAMESVERILFSKILDMYADYFAEQDAALDTKIQRLVLIQAAHLGLAPSLWLLDPDESEPPYHEAITEFRTLPMCLTPTDKLKTLVRTASRIVKCITAHHVRKGNPSVNVTAEELLPLYVMVVIKSGVKKLHSQVSFLEALIDETDQIHEEGYMLATVRTCLRFVEHLDEKSMAESANAELAKLFQEPGTSEMLVHVKLTATQT